MDVGTPVRSEDQATCWGFVCFRNDLGQEWQVRRLVAWRDSGAARQPVARPPKVGAIELATAMNAWFFVRSGGDRLVNFQKKREKSRLRHEIGVFDS